MDETDRQIIFNLFKDGRISQSKLAKLIGITPASLNVRFKKLMEDGIIRGFKVFVNPNYLNKYFAYYAFPNVSNVFSEGMFVRFNCLERFNVYGFHGDSIEEIRRIALNVSKDLGKPLMEYIPRQTPVKPKKYDLLLLSALAENPRAQPNELAERLKMKASKLRKMVTALKGFAVIPEVDLIKADSILLGTFTRNLEEVRRVAGKFSVISIEGSEGGVEISFVGSLKNAKTIADTVKGLDREAEVMLVHDYWIGNIVSDLKLSSSSLL